MLMLKVRPSTKFKKDAQRLKRRGFNLTLLNEVIKLLATGERLPEKYQEHQLVGQFAGCLECHVANDWLLVYEIDKTELKLLLTRTGTHSDLFKK